MRTGRLTTILAGLVLMAWLNAAAATEDGIKEGGAKPPVMTESSSAREAEPAAGSGGVILAPAERTPDPCLLPEVTANPTRPNWDTSASTTQCGVIEIDTGWMIQPMGAGVKQNML